MMAVGRGIADLDPAYFAVVMATGIVSVACHLLGLETIADVLLALNLAFYPILAILYIARLLLYPGRFFGDLRNHASRAGYFTVAAGTGVLGSQLVILRDEIRAAATLWVVGIVIWLAVTYAFFAAVIVRNHKPRLDEGLAPTWLLAVVAAESVSVLGGLVARAFGDASQEVLFMALVTWLAGGALYVWLIALIFYRCAFLPLTPAELTPPYWINMGAMAIATLAGSGLVASTGEFPVLANLAPFLKGVTLLFWVTATLWIPLLAILGVWKYLHTPWPPRYGPSVWGAVFPLGMYTAATSRLAEVMELPFLLPIPQTFIYVALAAWAVALLGLIGNLLRTPLSGASDRQ